VSPSWKTALDAWVLQLTVVGVLRGMSEVGGPGDKEQELKAQVAQKARKCVPRRSRRPRS
jgi:hypothetical protein